VATHGTLNAAKIMRSSCDLGIPERARSWSRSTIGNGRALDPAKYFIIVVNQIENGLSTSRTTAVERRPDRPSRSAHCDDVRAQHKLLTENTV